MSDPQTENIRNPHWISYTRAEEVLNELTEVLEQPRAERMQNIALIGDTNNGKTTLLSRFIEKHNPPLDPNVDRPKRLIIKCDMPPVPDETRLYQKLLKSVNSEGSPNEKVDSKFSRFKTIAERLETRMLIIDETTNISAIKGAKLNGLLNAIKQLGNELQVSIVLAGLPAYMNVIAQNEQLANRFSPAILPRWKDDAQYASLLLAFERTLGLKNPSDFKKKAVVTALHTATEGLIGETGKILRVLAKRAIESGKECIDIADLSPDVLRAVNWIRPSARPRLSGT